MGLLTAIIKIASTPIICANEIVKDVSGKNDGPYESSNAGLSICTLGISSIIKGVAKTVEKAAEELDE